MDPENEIIEISSGSSSDESFGAFLLERGIRCRIISFLETSSYSYYCMSLFSELNGICFK
jgi:hypothetical protein